MVIWILKESYTFFVLGLTFLYLSDPDAAAVAVKWLQSCPTLCDPIDSSPRGSPVPGILQARTSELVAIAFSTHPDIGIYKTNKKIFSVKF